MLLSYVLPVFAALASAASAIPATIFEDGLVEQWESQRTTGKSNVLPAAAIAMSKKVCKTAKKRAVDELSDGLSARTGSGDDSEYDSDGQPLVEVYDGVTTLMMKGVDTVHKSEAISVAGVNSCTALFFFNSARTSRTGGHLTADDEAKIAKKTARRAADDGNKSKAVIRAPDQATITKVKKAIEEVFKPSSYDAKTYAYEEGKVHCFAFTYNANSNTLEESQEY